MSNLKNTVADWFKTDRNFESGKTLYMRHGSNLSFKNVLNRVGNTSENFKNLCYELAKIAGIAEMVYKQMLAQPIAAMKSADEKPITPQQPLTVAKMAEQLADITIADIDYNLLIELAKELDVTLPNRKKDTVIETLEQLQLARKVAAVPVAVKRSIKLRDQFPFLKRKDCPGVLKELVADMLTDYENYVSKHGQLANEEDPALVAELSKEVVEDYLDNRAIWDELKHYNETGQLLGQHPIFEWVNRRDEIRKMSAPDLVKLRDQLNNKIPRTRKLIADEPEHKDTAKRLERVDLFEKELAEVKAVLGLNG